MRFIKCPRCELNYMREGEQYCSVCRREMQGEEQEDSYELCSVCGENPVMPGKDVCLTCYKEMTQQEDEDHDSQEETEGTDIGIDMENVTEMDEIEMDNLSEEMPSDIGVQISLEEERNREEKEAEEEEREDEE